MGGDPIPGPWDVLREWFEAWKATLPKVTVSISKLTEPAKRPRPNYIHGNLNRKREGRR